MLTLVTHPSRSSALLAPTFYLFFILLFFPPILFSSTKLSSEFVVGQEAEAR